PALLAVLGDRVDLLRVRPRRKRFRTQGSGAWRRWANRVTAHPILSLVLASAPLLYLAWQSTHLDTSMPRGDWLPKGSASVRAYHRLEAMGRENLIHSLRVVLDFPKGVTIETPQGWDAARRLYEKLKADPRVMRVQCLPGLGMLNRPDGLRFLPLLPPAVRQT